MTNKTIQDSLNFFALAGTKNVAHENRMFTQRKRKPIAPNLSEAVQTKNCIEVKRNIQLSLF